jgi:hypothetical protein
MGHPLSGAIAAGAALMMKALLSRKTFIGIGTRNQVV